MHGARGGAPKGERNGNYRHGVRTKGSYRAGKAHSKVGLAVIFGGAITILVS